MSHTALLLLLAAFLAAPVDAQSKREPEKGKGGKEVTPEMAEKLGELGYVGADEAKATAVPPMAELLVLGREHLLAGQETIGKSEELWEWPYEGVYRERGQIPIGYRVGGTAICAWSLLELPGEPTAAQTAALHKANRFLLAALEQPAIQPGFNGGYDVRDWGVIYALHFFLRQEALGRTPEDLAEAIHARIPLCVSMLVENAIPQAGGWAYARQRGGEVPGPSSPFMTAPALLALWEAQRQGHAVDAETLERALISLERARVDEVGVGYSAAGGLAKLPGTIGRTPATEIVLHLAGRGSVARITESVDAFLEHWEELEKRRRKTGTHEGDYGIAPYYFYYAHYYAAVAIEMTPEDGRDARRARFLERLYSTWDPEQQFNDRVFARSSHYGTAMSLLALRQPALPPPAGPPSAEEAATAADGADAD